MASSRSVTASLQRNLLRRHPFRSSTQLPRCLQSNSGLSRPRTSFTRILGQSRAFSVSIPRKFADVNEDFDPKSIERESDEVDVCIVGGGKLN